MMEIFLIHMDMTLRNITFRKLDISQTKLLKSNSLTRKKKLKKLLQMHNRKRKELLSTNQWEVYFIMQTIANYRQMLKTNWERDWDQMLEQKNGLWHSQNDNLPINTIKSCDNLTNTKNRGNLSLELKFHLWSNRNQTFNKKWNNFLSLFQNLNLQ